tara:strand:+ start:533 stop:826 length:294 start_codon:yes stop_codon:yes gene_type:complete
MSKPLDHDAIFKAYPNCVTVDDSFETYFLDKDGNKVTFDQTLVDAARVELAKLDYRKQRLNEYPPYWEQLEYIYDNGIEKWKTDMVDPIKNKYPKPS